MPTTVHAILLAAIVLNVLATIRVLRRPGTGRKSLQVAFVWLVPFFGAGLVWSLANEKPRRKSRYGDAGGGDGGGFSFGDACHGGGGSCGGDGGGDGGGGGD